MVYQPKDEGYYLNHKALEKHEIENPEPMQIVKHVHAEEA